MKLAEASILVVDLETTGVNPATADVVEIAAVLFRGGVPVHGRSELVRPPGPIPESAAAIHGISDEDVASAPPLLEAASFLATAMLHADAVAGYNLLRYDLPILDRLLGVGDLWRCKPPIEEPLPVLDGLVAVRLDSVGRFWKGKGRHQLVEAYSRLGLTTYSADRAHRALGDCYRTGEILWSLRESLPEDLAEASLFLSAEAAKQEANFQAFIAKQGAPRA